MKLFLINALVIFAIISANLVSSITNQSLQIDTIDNTTKTMAITECPNFMSLFPTDENSTEMICDCTFGYYLYYPETDSCYSAYEKGPCPPEHYLVLPPNEDLAKCEKNPCIEDGLVPFYGNCAHLWRSGPPCLFRGLLSISSDITLICTFDRKQHIINAPSKVCPPGSRRNALGNCKKTFI